LIGLTDRTHVYYGVTEFRTAGGRSHTSQPTNTCREKRSSATRVHVVNAAPAYTARTERSWTPRAQRDNARGAHHPHQASGAPERLPFAALAKSALGEHPYHVHYRSPHTLAWRWRREWRPRSAGETSCLGNEAGQLRASSMPVAGVVWSRGTLASWCRCSPLPSLPSGGTFEGLIGRPEI
jgi:hypothetical protein